MVGFFLGFFLCDNKQNKQKKEYSKKKERERSEGFFPVSNHSKNLSCVATRPKKYHT
jgi:hypothetical protein